MEIIKQGTLPEEQTYETTCTSCETSFRFQRKEARYVSGQREGDSVVIECPTCQKECWVVIRKRGGQQCR